MIFFIIIIYVLKLKHKLLLYLIIIFLLTMPNLKSVITFMWWVLVPILYAYPLLHQRGSQENYKYIYYGLYTPLLNQQP